MVRAGSLHKLIPVGQSGNVRVIHDSPDPIQSIRASIRGQALTADTYTRLLIDENCCMTDAEFECVTAYPFERSAKGDILVVGLGLGLAVRSVLDKPSVTSVTILEINQDVIDLISPTIIHPKLRILKGDAYSWRAPRRAFDLVYFDIWQNVPNSDNRKELTLLRKHYRPSLRKGGRTMAWCEDRFTA